jgi:ABC-type Fe3+/spermidine/putrescine transport system ATPase subunit
LVGLYEPHQGKILYNGTPSNEIDFDELRNQIGFVTQDTQLFSGTIKENLLFVNPRASDEEIINFFVSNFASCDDPQSLWIGQIIKEGEETYTNWMRRKQSLSYIFKEEVSILNSKNFDEMFSIQGNKHPLIIKNYLQKKISLETLIILNNILEYTKEFDKKLQDPVWEFVSMRIEKYSPFIHIDSNKFKSILRECVM